MKDLKITLIQSELHWEDKNKNLEMFSGKISSITEPTDLIVLPEMFTTGFSMKPEQLAEDMNGDTISWMTQQARQKNCVITGSFICIDGPTYYNRLVWMSPDGSYKTYDKRHLFRMGQEDDHYGAGKKKLFIELKGWNICPLICYDLRFPVWSRNIQNGDNAKKAAYDVLIYVANWPERRAHPWKTLLLARAIENQSYVVGLNRVGSDGNNIYHSGDSAVINAKGEMISNMKANEETIQTITLSYSELIDFRNAFPVALDADNFEIN